MKVVLFAYLIAAATAASLPRDWAKTRQSAYNFVGRVNPATKELIWPSTFRITGVASDGTLISTAALKRKIEIIGDSISVGYGLDGVLPCTDSAVIQNNGKTYGALAARALDANYSVVAWSGKGLIRNYASNPPDSQPPMPFIYT
ncbi:hypothetical protein ACHAPT_013395 [Fusarium lateritium]